MFHHKFHEWSQIKVPLDDMMLADIQDTVPTVFLLMLEDNNDEILRNSIFGRTAVQIYVIELLNRCLPHAHACKRL